MKSMIKIIKSLLYKIFIILKQKTFKMRNGKKLKYIFFNKKSDELVVCFSGFPGENNKAKYNYMRTLKGINKNQVFILDNFGYQKAGSYYLGENGNFFLEEEIQNLINGIKKEKEIKKIYTIGTSKGGWASLYYGILLQSDMIICGAPQYYISDYLNTTEYHKKLLYGIIGNHDDKEILENLNNKLANEIKKGCLENVKFIVHYSKNEHTYEEHIKFLLNDLKDRNANVIEDVEEYLEHEEVGKYFRELLLKILKEE